MRAPPMAGCLFEAKSREPVVVVKKLLLVGAVAVGGFLVYRQVQDNKDKAEKDLWTEVTDPVPVPAKG
jgi:hypothetical protein